MIDTAERKELIQRVLSQWYARDSERLTGPWLVSTQQIATPMLRMVVDEVCANWTQTKRPQPGDLNAIANRKRANTPKRPEDGLSLGALQDDARKWLEAEHLPITPPNVMRQVRARIGIGHTLAPLSSDGWREALERGVVTHIPNRMDDAEQAVIHQMVELRRAGYGWCDEQRRFVPAAQVVDLDTPAEREGLPYPARSMSTGAIAGAHAMLLSGELKRMNRAPRPKSPDFEIADFEAREAMMFD